MKKAIIFLACILLTLGQDWQSSGNFTADNITFIFSTIDNTLQYISDGSLAAIDRTNNISDTLNKAWDQAWNVFYFRPDYYSSDAVVYGYAYNKHWFWANNYKNNSIGHFVIWKDYNCHTWMDTASISSPKMASDTATLLKNWFNSTMENVDNVHLFYDPWELAHRAITYIESVKTGQAFTVVMLADGVSDFSARFCGFKDGTDNQIFVGSSYNSGALKYNTYIVIKMR